MGDRSGYMTRNEIADLGEKRAHLPKLLLGLNHQNTAGKAALRLAVYCFIFPKAPTSEQVKDMIKALKNDEIKVHRNVAIALSRLDPSLVTKPLIHTLKNNKTRHVRENAAFALGKLGDPKAVKDLIYSALNDKDPGVKRTAITAINEVLFTYRQRKKVPKSEKVQQAAEFLRDQALETKDRKAREAYVYALGYLVSSSIKRIRGLTPKRRHNVKS
jgi:hypothetical protein